MPGPPPNKNARRRNARPDWKALPAAGRTGDPPAWPLADPPNPVERGLWRDLWATPQAIAWEELGWTRVVARYARCVAEAENPATGAGLLGEVRQLEDRLGLSPMSLKRLQWEIVPEPTETSTGVANIEDFRDRLAR